MHNLLPSGVSFAGGPGFEYQLPLIEAAVEAIIRGDREVLIAACPSAGKTNVAFEVVRRLVATGHVNRALVLAWARVAIKEQWLRRVREQAPGLEGHLFVDIPQRRHRLEGTFDLLCVDEGHQNYEVEGGMVSQVRAAVKARTTLILTGSPSVFVRRGLKPAAVFSLEELHTAGKASNLTIEVGTSAYNLLDKHYNAKGDVTQAGQRLQTQARTDETLEKLLDGLHARLKLAHRDMDSAWNRVQLRGAKRKKWWGRILTGLKKTIVACSDIAQAEQAARYFRAQGVEVLVSHGGNDRVKAPDVDSENIEAFKKSAAPLLVVVDRAQLGYDNPELANFIDMTGSRNPDRIFQMLCRVVRVDPAQPALKKLFVKVMPAAFSDQNLLFFMEGVLNLARRDVFETYDGTGFYRGPVPGYPGGCGGKRGPRTGKKGRKRDNEIAWSPVLETGMSLYGPSGYFTAIKHTNADGYEPVGQVRLGEVVGKIEQDPEGRKQEIINLFKKNGWWPSSRDPLYGKLGGMLCAYTSKNNSNYDPAFEALVRSLGWAPKEESVAKRKQEIVEFFKKHGRWPHQGSKDPLERRPGWLLPTYVNEASLMYDPAFEALVRSLGWVTKKDRTGQLKEEVLDFFKKNGRWPSYTKKDLKEKRLCGVFQQYLRSAGRMFDPDFLARCAELDPARFGKKS